MTRASEIQWVKRTGTRIRTGHLDVRIAASPFVHAIVPSETKPGDGALHAATSVEPGPIGEHARVGIVVPKYKRTGVERNRLRRRLRELVRTQMLPVIPSCDVVMRPFPNAYDASYAVLAAEITSVIHRIMTRRETRRY